MYMYDFQYWFLIISSKDSFVKFWDLDTQHCFLTLVGHRSEVSKIWIMTRNFSRLQKVSHNSRRTLP